MRTLELPQAWRDRALVLIGGEPDRSWFTEEELRTADAFRLEKRRVEWMLSRTAAKQLAMQRGVCTSPHDVIVTRPTVLPFHVSLSHSDDYNGAAIDSEPIGIDVQTVRGLRESAAHFFLTDEETAQMRACAIADAIIHFWSAKEAAWKRLGGSIETLKRVPLRLEDARESSLRFDSVETQRIGDVVVALTLPTSSAGRVRR